MMFRMLVLQSLYNLSDVQIEYQVWDRATFTRFVGLGSEDCIPDGTTLWLFREKLARAGLIETLFDRFDQHLTAKGSGWRRSNAGGLTRSIWRADWLPLEGEAGPPRRKKPAAGRANAPLHKLVQRPIADFDEIRHESEVSRRSHRESVILRGPLLEFSSFRIFQSAGWRRIARHRVRNRLVDNSVDRLIGKGAKACRYWVQIFYAGIPASSLRSHMIQGLCPSTRMQPIGDWICPT